jgi:hypothetical protein
MAILIWVILAIVNAATPVPAWLLVTFGIFALIEAAWYVFLIVLGVTGIVLEKIQDRKRK